jgi:hypothetical protein
MTPDLLLIEYTSQLYHFNEIPEAIREIEMGLSWLTVLGFQDRVRPSAWASG